MLVLLTVVLITASFISQGKIQVNVPKASTAVAFKSDELAKLLTVTADKQLYFNDRPITQEALEAEIAQWNKDQKVTLKIDAEASFQDFVTITDMLSKNEIKNVAIVSMKDKGKSAGKKFSRIYSLPVCTNYAVRNNYAANKTFAIGFAYFFDRTRYCYRIYLVELE